MVFKRITIIEGLESFYITNNRLRFTPALKPKKEIKKMGKKEAKLRKPEVMRSLFGQKSSSKYCIIGVS